MDTMTNNPPLDFSASAAMLKRALEVIPLGTQTFSKSYTQYPRGVSPHYVRRAQGALVTDIDGNEFIDFSNALAAVTLGHCDPDVTEAVERQLRDGTIFSLAHPLEVEVAEMIVEAVPCAEAVRFGKNGSDATAGAVRAARAFTGRDHIAVCGYHGWQDWYIATTTRDKGVPAATRELSHKFAYNDLESLRTVLSSRRDGFAAVILEPMNVTWPRDGFLQGVVDLAHEHGALAIFDETITGFRFSLGGAQELFGVTPDIASFGKGLANGYPLSAVAGRADVMREFENVFFSFTMGGETLSLAAAKATIEKLKRERVIDVVRERGERLQERVPQVIAAAGCDGFLSVSGHPSWSFLTIKAAGGVDVWDLKTLWMQGVLERGILSTGTHNLSFAHQDDHVDRLIDVYAEVFGQMKDAIDAGTVEGRLRCEPLKPLFTVR